MRPRLPRRCATLAALVLASALALAGGWIHAKAALAQWLLQRAWQQTRAGQHPVRPWPWADMAPIARLQVPRLAADLIVLDDDSGQALAFGPGWTPASAEPASRGISVISAHRDTQFTLLQSLHPGDRIELTGLRARRSYRVTGSEVVDSRNRRLPSAASGDALLLVTCYPFDAVVPGGPLRYVVRAAPVNAPQPRAAGGSARLAQAASAAARMALMTAR